RVAADSWPPLGVSVLPRCRRRGAGAACVACADAPGGIRALIEDAGLVSERHAARGERPAARERRGADVAVIVFIIVTSFRGRLAWLGGSRAMSDKGSDQGSAKGSDNGNSLMHPSLKHRSAALTDGPARAPARSYFKAIGFTDADLRKPLVGVANTWTE